MRHSTWNTILTKLSLWEHNNRGTLFSRQKFSKVSQLVRYVTLVGFRACVYGACQHAHVRTSRSPSKLQTYWCMSHTRGNWCHLVTWVGTITLRWLCTLYSMNMHLQQLPWAYTYSIKSRTLMTREGHSHSHDSPSHKVRNHPHTHTHTHTCTYTHIYIYIYIHIHLAQCYHIEWASNANIANAPRA